MTEQRKGDQTLIDVIRPEEGDLLRTPPPATLEVKRASGTALNTVLTSLEDAKAEDIITIDIAGKSALGDHMVVTSGRSHRHVGAIADRLLRDLKDAGFGRARVEGLPHCDWVLIDASDLIIHIFRPEVREFYNIEKMWMADAPAEFRAHA